MGERDGDARVRAHVDRPAPRRHPLRQDVRPPSPLSYRAVGGKPTLCTRGRVCTPYRLATPGRARPHVKRAIAGTGATVDEPMIKFTKPRAMPVHFVFVGLLPLGITSAPTRGRRVPTPPPPLPRNGCTPDFVYLIAVMPWTCIGGDTSSQSQDKCRATYCFTLLLEARGGCPRWRRRCSTPCRSATVDIIKHWDRTPYAPPCAAKHVA